MKSLVLVLAVLVLCPLPVDAQQPEKVVLTEDHQQLVDALVALHELAVQSGAELQLERTGVEPLLLEPDLVRIATSNASMQPQSGVNEVAQRIFTRLVENAVRIARSVNTPGARITGFSASLAGLTVHFSITP